MNVRGRDEISNMEDCLDSRDIIARIDWLAPERDKLQEKIDEVLEVLGEAKAKVDRRSRKMIDPLEAAIEAAQLALETYYETDEGQELKALEALQEQCQYGDWTHGAQLIHDRYFTKYAQELADDLSDCKDNQWPYTCIDWEQAADELKQDYTQVDFDGEVYWLRA